MRVLLFLLLFSAVVSAVVLAEEKEEDPLPADFELKTDSISEKYFAGAFLIYDCEENHWVCVLKEDYKKCEEKRESSKNLREKHLPCAPVGEFPTKRSCFQRQLYLTGKAHGSRFCLLDALKKEE